jgi:hypothetical protein
MASPIQIILNPENFDEARERGGGGRARDFFAHRDREFQAHRAMILGQLNSIAGTLSAQRLGQIGYLKVILRREAWAKSHRPMGALFAKNRTPLVGGADIGVMIVEARPSSLVEVAGEVLKAEPETRMKFEEARGKDTPNPSLQRSETGAIEKLELYSAADRRDFSVEEAVTWLSNPLTGGSYEVELFDVPAPRPDWDRLDASHLELYRSFVEGLAQATTGMAVERLPARPRSHPLLAIRLDESGDPPVLRLHEPPQRERRRDLVPFSADADHHRRLLAFLESHPLVRRISLPGIVVRSAAQRGRSRPTNRVMPVRNQDRSYPRLGIIDGGIGGPVTDWVLDRWGLLAAEDQDLAHGTFIGGLAAAGASLNGPDICPEPDGAELIDIDIFPDEAKSGAFGTYFDGLPQFFHEMGEAIADMRARHDVRVFNMSLNILQPAAPDRYSPYAAQLDQIAEANDAVLFISAGNIDPRDVRAEWPVDVTAALGTLAASRNDGLLLPAESARNVAVAALNPSGHAGCVAHAPARFSRRGPGLRAGVKPDLAHIGGAGTVDTAIGHGLFSVRPDGTIIDGCGTSYASPLVAKTAATLAHQIEGEISRETLIGLLVHHAEIPKPLHDKAFSGIVRHLVGFGMPPSAAMMLEGSNHSITLVFASRIARDNQINFRFRWPESLVQPGGRCRGFAKLTLVSTPPLDPRFGSEFVRANVSAALRQEHKDGWKGRLDPIHLPPRSGPHAIEAELIEHNFKWSPVKVFEKSFPRGVGASSNWRLSIEYLTRAGEIMPMEGVPFSAILTIADLEGAQPVFNDVRQSLQAMGVQISDIRTAARITSRV